MSDDSFDNYRRIETRRQVSDRILAGANLTGNDIGKTPAELARIERERRAYLERHDRYFEVPPMWTAGDDPEARDD